MGGLIELFSTMLLLTKARESFQKENNQKKKRKKQWQKTKW